MKINWLITNGLIFDGSFSEPYEADVGISSDKIVFVNKKSRVTGQKSKGTAEKIIDARHLAVAPGFIDTHSHSEFTLLADSRAEGKVCQGITTEINGNCGLSAAPLCGHTLVQREDDLKELGIRERWSTFNQYFHILKKKGIAINFATLAGHGNIRASVIGYEDNRPDEIALKKMKTFLKKAISEGALGLSAGLIYPPGVYSKTEELVELCKVLSESCNPPSHLVSNHPLSSFSKWEKGGFGIYTTHMRSEGDRLLESIEETIRIGIEARIKIHISHIKTSGRENWNKIGRALSLMEEAGKQGVSLTCDAYPYTASSTDLDTVLPSWVYSGGREGELKRLKNTSLREKIKKQILDTHPAKDYWKKISISSVSSEKNRWMEGRSLYDIASLQGKEPVEILFDILIEEKLMVSAIFASMHEGNLKKFLSLPYCMIGTDSSARSFSGTTYKGKPHPRGFGSFPRFLGKYVRDERLMSMGEGIHKITMLPGRRFGIHKRGIIKRGAYADIVIFDHKRVIDKPTFKDPFLKSEGIYYVFVNGVPALWEGQLTNSKSGRILRHGR
jgi:N-acyl-D-amino-acid deacylase